MPNETPDMLGYRLLQKVLVVCASLVLATQLGFLVVALDRSQARCREVQDIRSYILSATERALTATPQLAYYRTHPDELDAAMSNLRRQRDEFREPLHCTLL